ncbi:rhodanese-like domain-containing protein [Paenibacillus sp. JNUCC31]|uniref:rhodanese-like domain-containing protein n=1 Tax=Paenibacillus sp. JNUCC-31 TaxID=2777983 RepID=UPI00177A9297|nr:rhodanese-like domain-containing protein [Paenibacillus sp. JNUCC-31]QOS79054.1 rhodanese-like domain-containing protein [Paenibacillus sp. JNUCC-31]
MFWLIFLSVIIIFFVVGRQLWPVPNLKHLDYKDFMSRRDEFGDYKILDIRDALEYWTDPTAGTINISLGRLPYVWGNHLIPEDHVMILSTGLLRSKKAARILRKQGFQFIYVIKCSL